MAKGIPPSVFVDKQIRIVFSDELYLVIMIIFRRPQKATNRRMEGDLIYHYRGEELVGVTSLHAKGLTASKDTKQRGMASSQTCWARTRLQR